MSIWAKIKHVLHGDSSDLMNRAEASRDAVDASVKENREISVGVIKSARQDVKQSHQVVSTIARVRMTTLLDEAVDIFPKRRT